MGRLRYPAPRSFTTDLGAAAHVWEHPSPLGDPVLLVHGYGSNTLFNWVKTGWLDPMADLGRSIISIDMPGHGDAKSTDPAGMRTGDLVDDLHQVITQHGRRAAVHGYSLGSRVCWALAHETPSSVSSLVMGGSPVSPKPYRVDADQARAWARGGPEPVDKHTRRFITHAAAIPDQNLPHAVELRLALSEEEVAPADTVPSVPTLVVAGSKDPAADEAPQLADWVQQMGAPARFEEIPGRNHINVLTSRDYKAAVSRFLEDQA
ncbi:alpha/beta fold hydrolase [Nesterenkonia sp. NBAIMH1]|uniref:alpha/beta fold hydrolase n=1 Tax=Nesterenkonia sp. NBAIMH1 TaxID=2600320 RepID=UPI0011B7D506|nr:alpha/beta fold hydrolase [Nesterenkonia sp. NBAIMH1]